MTQSIIDGLTEAQRVMWIRTILAMAGTAPQRQAFIDGYNGQPFPKPRTPRKVEAYALGQQVATELRAREVKGG